jgi:hypothetical protein
VAGPTAPEPVKLFVAVLHTGSAIQPEVRVRLSERFGGIDFEGPARAFDLTDYYAAEMGPNLTRRLLAFDALAMPGELPAAKLACNAIEDATALRRTPLMGAAPAVTGRCVNLDMGYLDHNKIVLASAKAAGQKIYLSDGIYADLVARYEKGRYQPFAWTFPDFKDGRYDAELATLRARYLEQIKTWRRT